MKKKKIAILSLVLIVMITGIVSIIHKQNQKKQEDNIEPVIYYSMDEMTKKPLLENIEITNIARISWTKECMRRNKKRRKENFRPSRNLNR